MSPGGGGCEPAWIPWPTPPGTRPFHIHVRAFPQTVKLESDIQRQRAERDVMQQEHSLAQEEATKKQAALRRQRVLDRSAPLPCPDPPGGGGTQTAAPHPPVSPPFLPSSGRRPRRPLSDFRIVAKARGRWGHLRRQLVSHRRQFERKGRGVTELGADWPQRSL